MKEMIVLTNAIFMAILYLSSIILLIIMGIFLTIMDVVHKQFITSRTKI
jgi:hypothetical protein